jgi:hypothetical protein
MCGTQQVELVDSNVLMGRKPTVPVYLRQPTRGRKSSGDDADNNNDNEVLTGLTRTTSNYRPDDSTDVFLQPEDVVRFGEVAERPPDLAQFANKIESKKRKKEQAQQQQPQVDEDGEGDDDDEEAEAGRKRTKGSKKKRDISEISTGVDDSYNPSVIEPTPKSFVSLEELKQKKAKGGNSSTANAQEMEAIRLKAMQAYDALRKKRMTQKS